MHACNCNHGKDQCVINYLQVECAVDNLNTQSLTDYLHAKCIIDKHHAQSTMYNVMHNAFSTIYKLHASSTIYMSYVIPNFNSHSLKWSKMIVSLQLTQWCAKRTIYMHHANFLSHIQLFTHTVRNQLFRCTMCLTLHQSDSCFLCLISCFLQNFIFSPIENIFCTKTVLQKTSRDKFLNLSQQQNPLKSKF